MGSTNSFNTRTIVTLSGEPTEIFSLSKLEQAGFPGVASLPYSLKILLENLLRHEDGRFVHAKDIEAVATWKAGPAASKVQKEISYEKNAEKVNNVYKVIIDKKEAGRYLGRTEFDSVEVDNEVVVHSNKELAIGEFVNVQITKAYDYDLEGKAVE